MQHPTVGMTQHCTLLNSVQYGGTSSSSLLKNPLLILREPQDEREEH